MIATAIDELKGFVDDERIKSIRAQLSAIRLAGEVSSEAKNAKYLKAIGTAVNKLESELGAQRGGVVRSNSAPTFIPETSRGTH